MRLERVRAPLGEREAGHDVRDPDEAIAEDASADLLAVRLVGDREDRVGVRVIDEARREEGVKQRLDARGRRARVEQVGRGAR
jgi:hypothetical protein